MTITRLALPLFLFLTVAAQAALTRVSVIERTDVLDGRSLGPAGAYERVIAKAHFALDPANPANKEIRDLALAPRNAQGLVEFTADLYVLKPRDPAKGNGTLLFEVSNRGGKGMLSRFQLAAGSDDPRTEAEFGDLSLMQQGYTLAWLGWQWDIPAGGANANRKLRLDAPIATHNGQAITGLVRSEFISSKTVTVMPLSDRDHVTYPVVDVVAQLNVRDAVNGVRAPIPTNAWRLNAARTAVEMPSGFQPGRLYELVYCAKDPRVMGVSLAAVRDFAAFMKYDGSGITLLGDQRQHIKRAIAFGISQSGRFLRTFLYYGFNTTEKGKKAFDGIWADVAGGGRGSFNHRFAQASRDGYAYFNTLYQTDLFPFTDLVTEDAATGWKGGILERTPEASMPRIVYTNGSNEYWARVAALIHVTPDGKSDAPVPPNVRIYCISGAQHGPGRVPPARESSRNLANPLDQRPFQRAILAALHEWVKDGAEPPPSTYPTLAAKTLTPLEQLRFPSAIAKPPARPARAWRADYGPEFESKGIVTIDPPKLGAPYPSLVPAVDAEGFDLGGIRLPEIAAPLGVYTGWNLRSADVGSPDEMTSGLLGSFFPYTTTTLQSRYGSRDAYLAKLSDAVDRLTSERWLLPDDKQRILTRAGQLWDAIAAGHLK